MTGRMVRGENEQYKGGGNGYRGTEGWIVGGDVHVAFLVLVHTTKV